MKNRNDKIGIKNVKVIRFYLLPFILCCLALAVISGCNNLIDYPKNSNNETGTLILSINGQAAGRTIVPAADLDNYTEFKLDFSAKTAGNEDFSVILTDSSGTVELHKGVWDLTVTAYLPGELEAAIGELKGINVLSGNTVAGVVPLFPIEDGTGTFSWEIIVPEQVTGVKMRIRPSEELTNVFNDDIELTDSITLESGQYRVILTLFIGTEETVISEILHVYKNMESSYKRTFTEKILSVDVLRTIPEIVAYLSTAKATIDEPAYLPVALDDGLGTMTEATSGWQQLLGAIASAGKYVELDLLTCAMEADGIFNPVSSVSTGKDKIVSLVLPDGSKTISGGTSGSPSFRYFTNIKEISGNNISTIGNYSFYNCSSLISVDFPKVNSIGSDAFSGCRNLNNMYFPEVTNIGDWAFYNCSSLTGVDFPEVTNIGGWAFFYCSSLTSVNFPELTSIGSGAFGSCQSLVTVNIPNVTTIGYGAFRWCRSLSSVNLPKATSIDGTVFANCYSLISISFPASTNITFSTFSFINSPVIFNIIGDGPLSVAHNGKALIKNNGDEIILISYPAASGSIEINTITCIGDGAFEGNESVSSVSFPDVTSISSFAFDQCINLTTANFPNVISIGDSAFNYCLSLSSVDFPKATKIIEDAFGYCPSLTDANFPEVLYIEKRAFYDCTSLASAIFPKVITIDPSAFSGCTSLASVSIPAAASIGSNVFSGCTSLVNVSIPAGTNIYENAFSGCTSLVNVSIPATASIENGVFNRCINLTNFNVTGDGPLFVIEDGKALAENISGGIKLIAYPSASGGIEMHSIKIINGSAFDNCTSLISASFPEASSIGSSAFYGCSNLAIVSLPSVTNIEYSAFYRCNSLDTVILGTLTTTNFSYSSLFPGNLRTVYFAEGGGAGTYTTTNPGDNPIWVKQ